RLRTLSDGFARSARAKEILDVVKQGLARDFTTLPEPDTAAPVPADKSALVDMLRVLLKASASRHGVAPRLIADTEDLERIAIEKAPDVPALHGWRRDLFGQDALRLKAGQIALTVRRGEVVTTPIVEDVEPPLKR